MAIDKDCPLDQFDFDEFSNLYKKHTGNDTAIDPEKLAEIASPGYFIAVRSLTGGPAIPAFEESLKKYTACAIDQSHQNVAFFEQIVGSREILAAAVKAIMCETQEGNK